jgi:hypothetical protein
MKKLLVLGLLVYGAYLLTLQAPMLGLLWIVLLYWAGFNFVLFLLVLGIRSVFRFAAGCKGGMRRLTEARKAQRLG